MAKFDEGARVVQPGIFEMVGTITACRTGHIRDRQCRVTWDAEQITKKARIAARHHNGHKPWWPIYLLREVDPVTRLGEIDA